MNGLSVIVPSKNAINLAACVSAIWKHEPGIRIITVDDGIDWYEYLDINPQNARIVMREAIAAPKGFRFSRNVNLGIRAAGTDDVVATNDDALLQSPGGFSLLQSEQVRRPEFAIIGATTQVTGQPLQWRRDSDDSRGYGLRIVPHIAFVAVLIPRATIDTIGLLDERYVCGFEDRDYCRSVDEAHRLIGVHDGCYVDHGSLVSTVRGPDGKGYDKRGAATYVAKWGGPAK